MKKILSAALSAVMLLAMTGTAFASYEEAIDYVTDRQYMVGTISGFEADGSVTWAIACQTLYNLAGKPDVSDTTPSADAAGRWYADAAAWAKKTGLIKDAAFRGDAPVTGQELTELVHNYASAIGKSCPEDAVVSGQSVTRGQLAQLLYSCAPWNESYTEETVTFSVAEQDGIPAHEVVGTLTLPANAEGPVPAVVMLHGTGSTRHEAGGGYDKAAPILAKAGLATLRIDFMGFGDSTASDVDYSPSSANIDAKSAADYLASLDAVNSDAIGVMGWSQGGMNALLAAAAYPDTFKATVTWAGATGMRGESFEAAYETAKKDGYTVTEFTWRDPMHVGLRWYEDMSKLDVLNEVSNYPNPILAVQGSADTVVVPETADKIIAASSNKHSATYRIEDCDHTFNMFSGDFTAIEEASSATAKFFLENLLSLGYTEKTVTFSVAEQDGIPAHEVVGTLTLPVNAEGPVPAVVMLHGTGSTRHEAGGGYDKAAPILAQAGLATLRIDFMGAGDSTASDVDYSPSSANIDAKAAADYLASLDAVNGGAIGVMGWSQGGMNALLAAAAYPDTFKATVTWAGTTGMRQHFDNFDSLYETAKKTGIQLPSLPGEIRCGLASGGTRRWISLMR